MNLSRIVLTTGGTGGHIFPALAVAEEIRRRNADAEILFVGGMGPEGELARKAGLAFEALPARGVLGRGLRGILGLRHVFVALVRAVRLLGRFRPQAAVGFGGYACFAPMLAARLRGVPTALHEQNSIPGLTNRLLGKLVRRVFVSFPDETGSFKPARTVHTGNPVRPAIIAAGEARKAKPGRNLLVLGGSQGARAVNDAVIEALPLLRGANVNLRHQAGRADELRVKKSYNQAGTEPGAVSGFIEDMAGAYAWADLVLCRAGASTVFEVAAAGKPALLVPFPHATHDHQRVNARALDEAGAGRVLEQAALSGASLTAAVTELLDDPDALKNMAEAARRFARPDAAARIVDELERMTGAAA